MTLQPRNTALVLVFILSAIACSSCGQDPEKLAKEQAATRQRAEKESVEAMLKKYGAERIDCDEMRKASFTFQFEDALSNKSGRLIAWGGCLEDIKTEDGSLTAVISTDTWIPVTATFYLRCTRDQATRLASSDAPWSTQVFVVAKINAIQSAKVVRILGGAEEDPFLDLERIVVARGELIDFIVLDQ